MKNIQKKWIFLLGIMVCTFFMSSSPLSAAKITNKAKKDFEHYFEKKPWLGVLADEINLGPVKISHVHIHGNDKVVVVAPEEELHGSLRYRVKVEDLHSMHRYHLVIGIADEGAQDCVTHTMGIWDTKGKEDFTLHAPKKPGVYEVRVLFVDSLSCSGARDQWTSGREVPNAEATVGVIIVE